MLEFIAHLDKPAAWLVAVVAGIGALAWAAVVVLIYTISGWPEPPEAELRRDAEARP